MNIDELTDNQIIDIIMNGDNDIMKESMYMALNGIYGVKADRCQLMKYARQALKENKTLYCAFDDGETCDDKYKNQPHFALWAE